MNNVKLMISTLLIFTSLCESVHLSKLFQKNFDCNGNPACSDASPFKIIEKLESQRKCIFECVRQHNCVNFNYWTGNSTDECQLFDEYPYVFSTNEFCSNYDLYPRLKVNDGSGKNLAIFQRTCQSSDYKDRSSWYAVDGVYGSDFLECTHTNNTDHENNWFMVDLQYHVIVSHVRILARIGSLSIIIRYQNLTVGVTNSSWMKKIPLRGSYPLCGIYLGKLPNATWFQINCQRPIPPARFVVVHQVPVHWRLGGFLSLCEVQIYGKIWSSL